MAAKTKTEKIVAKNISGSALPICRQRQGLARVREATRKQQVATGRSKAREAGADIPAKPKAKRGSKASY